MLSFNKSNFFSLYVIRICSTCSYIDRICLCVSCQCMIFIFDASRCCSKRFAPHLMSVFHFYGRNKPHKCIERIHSNGLSPQCHFSYGIEPYRTDCCNEESRRKKNKSRSFCRDAAFHFRIILIYVCFSYNLSFLCAYIV